MLELTWSPSISSLPTLPPTLSSYLLTHLLSLPPPAFQKVSNTIYTKEGEQVEFSFPLNFEAEDLMGDLSWKAEGAPSSLLWISFTLNNKKLSVIEANHNPKLQMKDSLPLCFTLPRVSSGYAGSGNLTLALGNGQLQQEVKLVVMRGEEVG